MTITGLWQTANQRGTKQNRGGIAVRVDGVGKHFGAFEAIKDISFSVGRGEFLTLLGPSGSGKTTTLLVVAGFVTPDAGRVLFDEKDVTRIRPYNRDVGVIFQNYALFPHMTAADNIAFPLRMRRVKDIDVRRMVSEALDLVELSAFAHYRPQQLSGGQQQRVALARAVVFRPPLLLMDEPLGALDRKLRETLQLEIARISRQIGVTVIYVTHDQEEALTLSDRIAVYNHGRIEQIGTGEDLYERPVSLFVASFLGDASILRGKLAGTHQAVEVATPQGLIHVVPEAVRRVNLGPGDDVALVLRPERVQVYPRGVDACAGESDANVIDGMLTEVIYLGPIRKYLVETPGKQVIQARSQGGQVDDLVPGTAVHVKWRIADSVVVPQ